MGLILVQISAKRQLIGMSHWWLRRTKWRGRMEGKQACGGSRTLQLSAAAGALRVTRRDLPSTGWLIAGSQWTHSTSTQLTHLPPGGAHLWSLSEQWRQRSNKLPEMRSSSRWQRTLQSLFLVLGANHSVKPK